VFYPADDDIADIGLELGSQSQTQTQTYIILSCRTNNIYDCPGIELDISNYSRDINNIHPLAIKLSHF
jgi:hypothetical protein